MCIDQFCHKTKVLYHITASNTLMHTLLSRTKLSTPFAHVLVELSKPLA